MLDDLIHEKILATSELLALDPSVVEKDMYVTHAICQLAKIQDEHFQLAFAGGTCLAKAHRLVKRMSEDVDFKIRQRKHSGSNTQHNKNLKLFREKINMTIDGTLLSRLRTDVRNEGHFFQMHFEYKSIFERNSTLRPHVLLEFTNADIQLPVQKKEVITLIQSSLGNSEKLPICNIDCISPEETAAEKWVCLTRRISGIKRGYNPDDETLIRHIYDLAEIYSTNKINDDFFITIPKVITIDARQFRNQNPEYFKSPFDETQRSFDILKNDPCWEERYQNFVNVMLFEDANKYTYTQCLAILGEIIERQLPRRISEQVLSDENHI